jgi:beta-xylosidase
MVLLGVRPGGGTPGWHVLGRETFLAPVTWADGWPVVGDLVPGPEITGSHRDDFEFGELHPCWISLRDRPAAHCTTRERSGWLTLHARGDSLDAPDTVFVGRRQQHLTCRARTLVDASAGRGGLAVRLDEDHHYEIEAAAGEARVIARVGPLKTVVATQSLPETPVVLGVEIAPRAATDPRSGPDTIRLGLESDGVFTALAELDGKYLSTEVAGGFTGRVLGMYAAAGTVHFDWFDYDF